MSDKCKHGVRNTVTNLPYCKRCDDEGQAHSSAPAGSPASWPDIGLDPLKYREHVEGGVEGARKRLTEAVSKQQKLVPDQTMLAWRIDVSRVLDELTVMTARWENLKKYLPENDQAHGR